MMKLRMGKTYRNFVLSGLNEFWKNGIFLDTTLVGSSGSVIRLHRIVLASLSPLLRLALETVDNDDNDDVQLIFPDFPPSVLREFSELAYGLKDPDSVADFEGILDLCVALNMIDKPTNEKQKAKGDGFKDEIVVFIEENAAEYREEEIPQVIMKQEMEVQQSPPPVERKRQFQCDICGKVFNRKDSHAIHVSRHGGGERLKCDYCTKSFRTANDLCKHKKRLHAEACGMNSGYIAKCDICGRRFTDLGKSYQDHMYYHAGIKNYDCQHCDKRFATRAALREHLFTHSENNTHACKVCGKEFRRIQNVKQHLSYTHKITGAENISSNIIKLFLTGVDKAKALKELSEDPLAVTDM